MNFIKKFASIALVVFLIFNAISVGAVGNSKFDYTLFYDENSGTQVVEITGYKGSSNVKIPAKIGKNRVVSIGEGAFRGKKNIKSVSIGKNIQDISEEAFLNCSNLEKINLRNTQFIGQNAFKNCSKLKSVKIPDTLIGVTGDAFSECKNLKKFFVEDGNYYYESKGGVLIRKGVPYIVAYPQAKGNVYVAPKGIQGVGAGAFKGNKSIKKVVLKKDVRSIGENAFEECSNLQEVRLGRNVIRIGVQSFKGCRKLKKIEFTNNLISIDDEAFLGCTKLNTVKLADKIENIGDRAFGYSRKNGQYKKIKNIEIIASRGSKAENYARINGIKFKAK